MATLAVLRHEEGVRLNPDRLITLYATLGEEKAETLLARALGEVSSRVAEIESGAAAGNAAHIIHAARQLAAAAHMLGMATLVRVSGDIVAAAEARDATAQAAVVARLVRIRDRSLAAICDLRDSAH